MYDVYNYLLQIAVPQTEGLKRGKCIRRMMTNRKPNEHVIFDISIGKSFF